MKKILVIIMTVAMLLGGCVNDESNVSNSGEAKADELTGDIQPSASSISDFASAPAVDFSMQLFAQTIDGSDINPVISPISAYFALAMAANGAGGDTLAQFEELLGLSNAELNTLGQALIADLAATEGSSTLNIANSVWADDDRAVIYDSFLQDTVDYFSAEVYTVDLPSKEALDAINSWVNSKTNGLIDHFHDQNYPEDTVLVLLNTIYFKATWEDEFEGYTTNEKKFTLADGNKVKVDFLNERDCFREYISTNFVEGVLLPYDDGETAFIALRPTDGTTVADFVEMLNAEQLASYIGRAEETLINLSMPKFVIDYSLEMNDVLERLGLVDAFDPAFADFTRMGESNNGNIFISEVFQKVKIEVNEEGTEAAAVTEVAECVADECESQPIDLTLDSPYFYAVVDLDSNIPLFIGIMDDPS